MILPIRLGIFLTFCYMEVILGKACVLDEYILLKIVLQSQLYCTIRHIKAKFFFLVSQIMHTLYLF